MYTNRWNQKSRLTNPIMSPTTVLLSLSIDDGVRETSPGRCQYHQELFRSIGVWTLTRTWWENQNTNSKSDRRVLITNQRLIPFTFELEPPRCEPYPNSISTHMWMFMFRATEPNKEYMYKYMLHGSHEVIYKKKNRWWWWIWSR